jgi:hypothetical protein
MQQKAITLFHGDFFREVADDIDVLKMYVSKKPKSVGIDDHRCKYIFLRGKGKLVGCCYRMSGNTDVIFVNVKT